MDVSALNRPADYNRSIFTGPLFLIGNCKIGHLILNGVILCGAIVFKKPSIEWTSAIFMQTFPKKQHVTNTCPCQW